jgi:hypothetical protein
LTTINAEIHGMGHSGIQNRKDLLKLLKGLGKGFLNRSWKERIKNNPYVKI